MLKPFLSSLLSLLTLFLLLINPIAALDVSIRAGSVPQALLQLNVLDVKETWLNDKKALSIVFSHRLTKNLDYSNFITATVNGVSLKDRWIQADKNPYCLYLSNIKTDKKYEIFIRPGIASANGLKLLKPKHFNIMTQPVPASIDFIDKEKSFSIEKLPKLLLQTTGINSYVTRIYRLNTEKYPNFIEKLQQTAKLSAWQVADIKPFSEFVQQEHVSITAADDQRVTRPITLQQTTQLSAGLYFVSLKARALDGTQLNRLFYFTVSDIAIRIDHLASSTELVTFSKTQAKLLPNIKFTLISSDHLSKKKTDKEGRSHFLLKEEPYVTWVLISSHKANIDQFSLQKMPLRKKVYRDRVTDEAQIFLNKRNYKIGEKIDFSVILRDKNDHAIADQILYIKLLDAEQNIISQQAIVTPELGNASNFFQLPLQKKRSENIQDKPSTKDKKTLHEKSRWSVHVYRHEQDEEPLSIAEFYVGATDYLAAQLNIMTDNTLLTVDNNVPFLLKGYVDEDISPENLAVKVQRQIDWQTFASHKYKQFHFGTARDKTLEGNEVLQTLRLNAKGEAEFSLPKINNVLHSVLSVTLYAEMELDQQAIARESEILNYWPAKQLMGIYQHNAEQVTFAENQATLFEFIHINQANELLAADKVSIKIFKLSGPSNWHYFPRFGWKKPSIQQDNVKKILEKHILSWPKGEKGQLALSLGRGRYRVEVLNPETDLRTDYNFTLPHNEYDHPPNQLQLSLDKHCYKKNEIAILNIQSPVVADALIRISAEEVNWSKRVFLQKGENRIEIPIIKQLSHQQQIINVLGINKSIVPQMSLEGSLPLLLESLKTPLTIAASQDDHWQALRLHTEIYQNTAAIVVLSRSKGAEILLPEIMPLVQTVNFDTEGDALLNNSEYKIDPKQKYYATLYFVDQTVASLDVIFNESASLDGF